MTVYNHFPTEVDLFTACSTHWAAENPFPDPTAWEAIQDPYERLDHALKELYRWYRLKEDMLGNVFRDVPFVAALAEVMGGFWSSYVAVLVRILTRGWPAKGARLRALEAAIRLTIDFNTWQTLTGSGLSDRRAAKLAADMVSGEFRR